MPVDYAAALLGGQAVVPDYQAVEQARQQRQINAQLIAARRQQMEQAAVEAQRNMEREAAWGREIETVSANPTPEAVASLMLRYPDRREAITAAFDRMGTTRRTAEVRQLGAVFSMLNSGDTEGAVNILRQRIEADAAAGQDVADDQEVLAALQSDDPQARGRATAMIGATLAALEPDNFSQAYVRLNPNERTQPTTFQREYEWVLQTFGPQAAADFRANRTDRTATDAQGNVVLLPSADLLGPERDGGTPPRGEPLGGVPGILQRASESRRMSRAEYDEAARQLGPNGRQAMDGWLTTNGVRVEAGGDGPVRVRSVEEARRLPPGTEFQTPDGRTLRVPAR